MPVRQGGSGLGGQFSGLTRWIERPACTPDYKNLSRQYIPLSVEPAPANTYAIIDDSAGNTQVVHTGAGVYTIEKIAGTNGAFDAAAVSSIGLAGNFVLRARLVGEGSSGNITFVGMAASPTADDTHVIDYAWGWLHGSDDWRIYEGGGGVVFGLANATYVWIWRQGTTLGYGRGADLATAQASPDRTLTTSATLYFDSSLWSVGDKFEVLLYLPAANTTLAADSGVYAITGTATGLGAQRKLVAAVGAYALTGTATGLRTARTLALSPGAYSLSGTVAVPRIGRKVAAAAGFYVLAGTAAALGSARRLTGAVGSYLLTGTAATPAVGRKTAAAAGSYVVSGQTVGLSYGAISGYTMVATSGAYAVSGVPVVLRVGRRLIVVSGIYRITGNPAELTYVSIWTVSPPSDGYYTNDNPDAATWTVTEPDPSRFEEVAASSATWTTQEPATGTWN